MIDYEILRVIWWLLLGVLLIGFAVMDGFDMGVAMLLPFSGRTDMERRIIINTVAPVWEGNQVWLILGAGAIFAAWPLVYAAVFSGMYIALFLALLGLIVRPVSFKFRSKMTHPYWRSSFDVALCISSFVPALIFGVAIGNTLQGVPFHFDESLRVFYTGTFWGLLNPYSIICGLVSIAMMLMHGGVYLMLKSNDTHILRRTTAIVYGAIIVMLLLFTLNGYLTLNTVKGFHIIDAVHNGASNPLLKKVTTAVGAWGTHYTSYPLLWGVPFAAYVFAVLTALCIRSHKLGIAFITSGLCIASIIATVGVSIFPFILPSTTHLSSSLTVWDASSSKATLNVMLIATLIFVPIVIAYTSWVYRVLRGKVTAASVNENHSSY